ncbi:MAG: AAA family ATPase [Candidatus Pacebacteria bacterium]|nr:AAA family ATPase [Candidatus Paceibacterota bacterium]
MYYEFYGFSEPPFNITPDPRYLFLSGQHQEALNHLLYGIRERKGFIQLTGEVGSGKTTLCRAMFGELNGDYLTALILNPKLSETQLLRAILTELEVPKIANDRLKNYEILNEFLLKNVRNNIDVVLVIDEAQNLHNELLEQIRLLSNLETDNQKLIQIVLMGQPELRDKLQSAELRQLRQRITVRYHLGPLDRDETRRYIEHRIAVAGSKGIPYFDNGAIRRVYAYSRGIPRMINAIADKALLAGFVFRTDRITAKLVRRAARELEGKVA